MFSYKACFSSLALAGVSIGSLAIAIPAVAQAQKRYAIPAQDLAGALEQFGRQSDKEILFDRGQIAARRSSAVSGVFSAEAALHALLSGTGFIARAANRDTFVIERDTRAGVDDEKPPEDVIVTAQKRDERLIDVPVPVAAVSAATLVNANLSRVQDYYQRIPGLNLTTSGNGNETSISIRGITTGAGSNPTVGIVVDDVPFGPSITLSTVPDIDPSNLSRIEVLRGPQGSLYGASSMGGLIKFVTPEPSTAGINGMIQAGLAGVDSGKDVGFSVRGNVNVPLGDTLAVRASAFYRRDPGYIDNVATGARDVNEIRSKGGYASLLWTPSSTFSVRLGALVQRARRGGTDEADLSIDPDGLLDKGLPFTGISEQRAEVYSAVIKARVGTVDVTSISAYNYSDTISRLDATPLLGGVYADLSDALFGTPSTYLPYSLRTKAYTQELRINVPITDGIKWLIGGLIDYEDLVFVNAIEAFDTATGNSIGTVNNTTITQKYRNYALFSNLDLALSDRFSIQIGGRFSTNRQRSRTMRNGALTGGSTIDSGYLRSKESPFTFSVAPQWKIRPNLMVYARVASGYRPGGPNINCGRPFVACTYGSDRTVNYELGLKGDFFDRLVSIDASAYLIDWDDIQTLVATPNGRSGYTANGGTARSQGVELSMTLRPSRATTIEGWVAYNDSKLTEDFPAAARLAAFKGDRLPYSARWSGNISANHTIALSDTTDAFFGGNLSYVGKRIGTFQPDPLRAVFPSYWQFDLTAGLKWNNGWRFNAFVNNLTNERGILRAGADSNIPTAVTYIRPRSFGVAVSKSF
ncbi:TonB-dependent receptor [Sphingomonas sp.]|uniref:TonB-dependent receptor n=2 Tax=unclassified Sphingomonas TaxID=196159 RepID=UPI0025797D44|nr:TonB-dependent receptor [Sphingomonas sp.]